MKSRFVCVFIAIVCITNLGFAQGGSSAAKRLLYQQIMNDPTIALLIDQISRDPGDRAKVDTLLIQLPLSPLDMFQIRMELAFREYLVPREVLQLHQRWLHFHPPGPVSSANTFPVVNALMDLNPSLDAPTIGTNRNVASTDSPAPVDFQGEVQVAVNRNNTNQIVAGANTWDTPPGCDQTQAAFGTTDGGVTWNYSCAPSVGGYGLVCPNPGDDLVFGSDPALFWDNNNNAFLNYMLLCCDFFCQFGITLPTSSLVVAKSTDSGTTWTGHGVIVNHLFSTSDFDDKQFYIIDNTPTSLFYGRHYQCWDNNNDELFAYSTNGISWTQVNLPPPPVAGLFDLGCEMAVQSNGTIHLVFDALTCPGSTCSGESTYYTRSTNGGANGSWSAPTLVKSHNVYGFNNNANIPPQDNRGINPFGAIDVDNSTAFPGRLYYAYSDVNSGASMATSDIYVAYSTNNGVNWTHVKVNDDATSTAQFHPFLMVDQTNGNVVVGWHDARNDTANNRKIDYYISRSTDGGVTWEANTKVSQPTSEFNNNSISYSNENTTENAAGNPNQYGEYLGLDAHAGKAYMAWTDTRHYFPNNTSNVQKENLGFAVITYASGDIIAPTTSITSPTEGSNVNGTINLNADANDNIGVVKVEFYVDGNLIDTDNSSPYSVPWNTTTVTNGNHALTSKAYDAATNSGTSTPVNVNVNNPDSTPPTTSITSPTAGSNVSGTINVTANASDNVGVKKVEFYLDGNIKIGSDSSSPYKASWNTNIVPNGNHNLTSKAFDTSNITTISAPVTVNVNNPTNCTVNKQLITNPGFESGNSGWGRSSSNGNTTGVITNSVSFSPHSGSWYAKLDGFGTTTTQTITTNSSTMVIPAESCVASLSFWLSIGTAETTGANDTLTVQIQTKNNNGTFGSWTTIATFSNLDSTGINIYAQHTINMLPYIGKTVKLRWQAKENSSLQSTFLVDDVNLNVTQ